MLIWLLFYPGVQQNSYLTMNLTLFQSMLEVDIGDCESHLKADIQEYLLILLHF